MTKVELVAAVAEKAELSKKDAEKAVNATLQAIAEGMKNDGKVQLVGFGTFEIRDRAARKGLNLFCFKGEKQLCVWTNI